MQPEPMVYVVDDEPEVVRAVAEIVQTLGLRVESYYSAEEFLAAYESTGPACLVLNVRMPGMGGLALLEELTKREIALPTIVVTGDGSASMARQVREAGALEFLEKPFRTQDLAAAVRKAIELGTQTRRRPEQG